MALMTTCATRIYDSPFAGKVITYWEEEAPSRLDLGKEKYGGPFTEVEDVKCH